jgi:hypothetical protein
MPKLCIILGFLLLGANEVFSSEYGTIIPPGSSGGVQTVRAGPNLKPDKSQDIVLVGTVTKIYPVASLLKNWAVVVHVDRVVSGEFSDTTFTFTIHSPSMAGLRVCGTYIINATWAGEGYVVDESTLKEVRPRTKSSKKY